ncbi:ABC transporter substrate-binding protein [Glaciimonas sp. PCH181]|nr:ABC transporter substrate-binding protein [Glaciimonas sp. PCH181]
MWKSKQIKARQLQIFVIIALAITSTRLVKEAISAAPKTVVIGAEGAIPALDPQRTNGTIGLRVIDAIFDPLVREDLSKATLNAPELQPSLASSWTVSADGLTYTFVLRQNVLFHDGTPFNAASVQSNFERILDKSSPFFDERASGNMTFLTRWIKHTKVIDAHTFVIVLKEPFTGLPRLLSDRRMSIVSPDALNKFKGDQLGYTPVGTGPFMLKKFAQGQQLILLRNEKYWGGVPGVARLIFKPITDPTALAIAMQTGQIDIIPSASSQQVAQLKMDQNIQVLYPEPANLYFIRLNTRSGITKDMHFRQALNYAINRAGIAAVMDGQASPIFGPVPLGNEISGASSTPRYGYNPAMAKQLLAQAGIKTPVTLKLLSPNSGPGFGLATQIMSLIQQDLKAVGINLQTQYLDFTTLVSLESPGYNDDVNGSFNGWTTGAESGYWFERMFSGPQRPPRGVNRGWYQNVDVDKLFEQARGEVNADKKNKLYRQATEQVAADAPWVFLYQDRLPRLVRKRILGVQPARSVYIDYAKLTVR